MKLTKIYRYPRGYFLGGVLSAKICPALTVCDWQNNNFIVLEYE